MEFFSWGSSTSMLPNLVYVEGQSVAFGQKPSFKLIQVIPAIKVKWPSFASKEITIQQDNATPHILNDDAEFMVAANTNGFKIELVCQLPNYPDTNVNDLGWFRALQSLHVEVAARNVDELLGAVVSSFETLTSQTLNKVFLSLQSSMVEIIKHRGHNNYSIHHMKKDALTRQNALPTYIQVDVQLVKDSIDYLVENGEAGGMEGLMHDIESTFCED
ncbi:hypothetical protein ACS0TY_031138 [Phlomoides rotata]